MIKLCRALFNRPVLLKMACNVGRSKRTVGEPQQKYLQQQEEMRRSPRSKDAMMRKLATYCQEQDKPALDELFDKEFYHNIHNPQYLLIQVFPYKNTTDFYFRDYPSLIMNIQNEEVFSKYIKRPFDLNSAFIRKALVYMLSDQQALQKLISKQQKHPKTSPSFFVVHVKALIYLVLGQFSKAQNLMLEILNSPVKDLIAQKSKEQDQMTQIIMTIGDKVLPHILNYRQQILFNLLAYKMYTSTQETKQTKNTAMSLLKKIQDRQKLKIEDFQLIDYQSFLNIWLSMKFNSIMEWVDLNEQQKQPYHNYIYLLAQNAYINKEKQKAMQILSKLPADYPLRIFMQMSKLYDDKNFPELIKKYESIWETMDSGSNRFFRYPEYDIILQNAMKIMQKMHKFKKEEGQQLHLEGEVMLFKCEKNLRETEAKGIQIYYLNIPFREFLVHNDMMSMFEEEYNL